MPCQRRDVHGSTHARRFRGDRDPASGGRRRASCHPRLRAGGRPDPSGLDRRGSREPVGSRQVPGVRGLGPPHRRAGRPRMDADRPLAGRRRALRRRHGLAPPRPDRRPGRRRAGARRPLAQRRLRQRPARRVVAAGRRRRDRRRAAHDPFPGHRGRRRVAAGPGVHRRRGLSAAAARLLRSMAETITVLSLKGGTGKTTTVRTLADVFRRIGLDVLCVDLDPQGNLSDYFDVPADATPTIADVLSGTAKSKAATHDGIVPASPILAEVERGLSGKLGRELVLRKALKDARKAHDVILIDCPPALGLLTINGLVAADWALISSEAQYFALQGVNGALEVVELAKESLHPDLDWLGVVLNIADLRLVHARDARKQLEDRFGKKLLDTVIRRSVRYAESAERGVSILDYAPDLGADYLALADEVLARLGGEYDEARGQLSTLTPA